MTPIEKLESQLAQIDANLARASAALAVLAQPPGAKSPDAGATEELMARRSAAACSQVVEGDLTVEEVEKIHAFGECWINNYDRTKREYWEKALWLWAWEKPVVWMIFRNLVPTGVNPANEIAQTRARKEIE
jgi:hypothetical protein